MFQHQSLHQIMTFLTRIQVTLMLLAQGSTLCESLNLSLKERDDYGLHVIKRLNCVGKSITLYGMGKTGGINEDSNIL